MTKYGIIGSGSYRNKDFVMKILKKTINITNDIIISGHSPRNEFNNVDIWAEQWGNKFCKIKPIIFKPKSYITPDFKNRNKLIAKNSDIIIAFIPSKKTISGTWNTINYFTQKKSFNKNNLLIYDESENKWNFENYPSYLRLKIKIHSNRFQQTLF